jgi:hypothetical protein
MTKLASNPFSPDTQLSRKNRLLIRVGVPTAALVAAGLLVNSVMNTSTEANRTDQAIEKTVAVGDATTLEKMHISQIEGSATVNPLTHIRTSPEKIELAGETNDAPRFTQATKEDTVVILENPLVYHAEDGEWYGAKDPDSQEYMWVHESGVAISAVEEQATPDLNLVNVIYVSPSRESNA